MAMLPGISVQSGIDNAAVVKKGNAIIKHYKDRAEAELTSKDGQMILGGRTSTLQRNAPFKTPWSRMKDGDLLEVCAKTVELRGHTPPESRKSKGMLRMRTSAMERAAWRTR